MKKTLTTLAVILGIATIMISLRLIKDLSASLAIGIAVIGVVLMINPLNYFVAFQREVMDWNFWRVMVTIFSIYLLGQTMAESGDSVRFVNSIRSLFPTPRVAISLMPALIGLLPMPGGVMFSAPMVKEVSDSNPDISNEDAMVMNYWFRHTMEFFWPLYPAIIIVTSISGVPLKSMVSWMLPAGLVAIVTGYLLLVRVRPGMNFTVKAFTDLVKSAWPIIVIILCVMFNLPGWLVVLVTGFLYLMTKRNRFGIVRKSLKVKTFLLLFIVFFFKALVDTVQIPQAMSEELLGWSVPPIIVIIFLPFLMSFITGITQAGVGLAFPLIMSFSSDMSSLSIAVLGYTFAFMGVMLSPLHLCAALTLQYFDVNYGSMIKRVFIPVLTSIIMTLLVFLVL